jgi:hypothetical protein
MPNWSTYAVHSPYSDPGRHAGLLRVLPGTAAGLSAAARNVIAHYRAELPDLPEERRHEIDSRWLEVILAVDQERHGTPLTAPRPMADRVQAADHEQCVVAAAPGGAPFQTAAEVWQGYPAGELDPDTYGVFPGAPFAGPDFIRGYVIFQVAHRFGDELLLWDEWGATLGTGEEEMIDRLADLLVRADAGDQGAEEELYAWYRADDRLHPGDSVIQSSPYGNPSVEVSLRRSS